MLLLKQFQIFFSVLLVCLSDESAIKVGVLFRSFDLTVDDHDSAFDFGLTGFGAAHGCFESTKAFFAALEGRYLTWEVIPPL